MMGDPHPSVESVGRAVARRDIRRRQSVGRARVTPFARLWTRRAAPTQNHPDPASRMASRTFRRPAAASTRRTQSRNRLADETARCFGSFGSGSRARAHFWVGVARGSE